jgi:hypothetical protein
LTSAPAAKGTLIQDSTISVQIDGAVHAAQTLLFTLNSVATEIGMECIGHLNTTKIKTHSRKAVGFLLSEKYL